MLFSDGNPDSPVCRCNHKTCGLFFRKTERIPGKECRGAAELGGRQWWNSIYFNTGSVGMA